MTDMTISGNTYADVVFSAPKPHPRWAGVQHILVGDKGLLRLGDDEEWSMFPCIISAVSGDFLDAIIELDYQVVVTARVTAAHRFLGRGELDQAAVAKIPRFPGPLG